MSAEASRRYLGTDPAWSDYLEVGTSAASAQAIRTREQKSLASIRRLRGDGMVGGVGGKEWRCRYHLSRLFALALTRLANPAQHVLLPGRRLVPAAGAQAVVDVAADLLAAGLTARQFLQASSLALAVTTGGVSVAHGSVMVSRPFWISPRQKDSGVLQSMRGRPSQLWIRVA